MTLTIKSPAHYVDIAEWLSDSEPPTSHTIAVGETVEYIAHVPDGMVKARHNGQEIILHPGCTAELS